MTQKDYDATDMFEVTERKDEPLFSFNWGDALIIGSFVLVFVGVLLDIVHNS